MTSMQANPMMPTLFEVTTSQAAQTDQAFPEQSAVTFFCEMPAFSRAGWNPVRFSASCPPSVLYRCTLLGILSICVFFRIGKLERLKCSDNRIWDKRLRKKQRAELGCFT